ncbi:alkaline phosphatase D [Catalinimonas alkaloidigena]|uniref:alkaline phosphatase D family protein n=1 Tax=Catalinimonas alkaloidigena TaxID=1075417 RepID=UPI00240586CE|nr:alkaline phosphatase D family protein [Catalinimonas alkaloidigena]MDF9797772.1 alkaline phosphatase D [Catalinimonas alkaloidigena]
MKNRNQSRRDFLKKTALGTTAVGLNTGSYAQIITLNEGPYFGNGFHNGWADQNSIVIWTRLTKNPEMNFNGKEFIEISGEKHRELWEIADEEEIYQSQIPAGYDLDEMIGACPGADGEVRLRYYPENKPNAAKEISWTKVDPEKNFTTQWQLRNLTPDTKYAVELEARAGTSANTTNTLKGNFCTPPAVESSKDISFCIVTCHDFIRKDSPKGHQMYQAMLQQAPDFYVHTGDIEYYDKPRPYALTEKLMHFKWDRIFALPHQRNFYNQTTTYFLKDDHDTLCNDAYQGMTYGTVSFERGIEIFDKEQFPSNDKPYKTVRWGKDLQIWLMEGRNFRSKNTDPDGPDKTIWGKEQKQWLFNTLEASDAAFKVIISPTPILGPDRKNKHDNYANDNFDYEGDEIRDFINQYDNIFMCNGDRHWQYVTHWENTNLWEFGCGPGSDEHAGGWSQDNKLPEHQFLRVKGGFLTGRVAQENGVPILKFQHFDIKGNKVHEKTFKKE